MRRLLALFIGLVFVGCRMLSLSAQGVEITGQERQRLMTKVGEAAASVKKLDCTFTQTKRSPMLAQDAVSKGRMHYEKPEKLTWQYTYPQSFYFSVNGDSVSSSSKAGSQAATRMMRGLSSLIIASVSGSALFDERTFSIKLFDDAAVYRSEMTPRRRDMQRMFDRIIFSIDKRTLTVKQVELSERDGSTTTIVFQVLGS